MDFAKFNKMFNLDEIAAGIKEAQENPGSGNYAEVPTGQTYEIKIEKMELGETGPKSKRPGSPIFKAQFRILAGEFKNSCIFMNQVITQGLQIKIVMDFLNSLGSDLDVHFVDFDQFNNLIMDISEKISKLEYALDYNENSKGFKQYTISEIFEEVPF